jgi:hypothetical protein
MRFRRNHAANGALTHSRIIKTKNTASGITGPVLFTPCKTNPETLTSSTPRPKSKKVAMMRAANKRYLSLSFAPTEKACFSTRGGYLNASVLT